MNRVFAISAILMVAISCKSSDELMPPPKASPGPTRYIVRFAPGVQAVQERAKELGGIGLVHSYSHAIKGFAAVLSADQVEVLRGSRDVLSVTPDRPVHGVDVQLSAPWGLDRSDQPFLPLSETFDSWTKGAGVHVYVIDAAIRVTHQEFGGRATLDFDATGEGACHWHGTHNGAIAAGATMGLAKLAQVHSVAVLGCANEGLESDVVAGVDWMIGHAQYPAVANMSVITDSGRYESIDQAVQAAIAAGITVVAAAGNNVGADACTFSPAGVPGAITVAASSANDVVATFSNRGPCVDIVAPGVGIYSASNESDAAYRFSSGTSMAAPHVSGAAALYLSVNPLAAPAAVWAWLASQATPDVLAHVGTGTPNLLLRTTRNGQPNPSPPVLITPRLPTAVLTVMSCSGLTCTYGVTGSATDPDNSIRCDVAFGDKKKETYVYSTVTHTYAKAGTYSVVLTVTDAAGRKATATESVTIQ